MATKKKKKQSPQFIKNAAGKTTHVHLSVELYENMMQRVKVWEKVKKEKGVRWVRPRSIGKKK